MHKLSHISAALTLAIYYHFIKPTVKINNKQQFWMKFITCLKLKANDYIDPYSDVGFCSCFFSISKHNHTPF